MKNKMKILKVNLRKPNREVIKKAAEVIRSGGILIYPTEFCYAMGVNPAKPKNLQRLVQVKQRPKDKKFSWVFKDLEQVRKYCFTPLKTKKFSQNIYQAVILLSCLPKKVRAQLG